MPTAMKSRKPAKRGRTTTSPRKDTYADVTNRVLEQLEQDNLIWHKPWKSVAQVPTSLSTGKPYRGINWFLLMLSGLEKGYGSQYWGTYLQIQERGGQVRKGEEGTRVVFWSTFKKPVEVDGETQVKTIPFLKEYSVFNQDQADWADDARLPAVEDKDAVDPIEAAEALLTEYLATGPALRYGNTKAFYLPGSDTICMPNIEDFESAEHFYSTLYHEVTHSTGHSKRLARDGIAEGTFGAFGDAVYSFEELVAEMGAAMLCAVAGIDQAAIIPATAAYLAHWRDALKGDNKLIVRAANQAQKAVDLVLGTTFEEEEAA
jgi:antirestriction protein ArdC